MDANYFGFSENPFALNPVPEFTFQSSNWLQISEQLAEDLRKPQGIILLTGESGVGKSLLLRELTNRLRSRVTFAYPTLTGSDIDEFAESLLGELGLVMFGNGFFAKDT